MMMVQIFFEKQKRKWKRAIPRNMRLAEIMAELVKYRLVVEVQKS